jgi:hypothetical protein
MHVPAPTQQLAVQVYPCGRRGDFAAFVGGDAPCGCGAMRLLLGRLIFSDQPFIDAARMLLALGADPKVVIVMTHGLKPDIALRSTVGDAAAMALTSSRHGTPIFAKMRSGLGPIVKCAPAGPGLYSSAA